MLKAVLHQHEYSWCWKLGQGDERVENYFILLAQLYLLVPLTTLQPDDHR